jgi:ABC-type multidrug transport system ATPase subunit
VIDLDRLRERIGFVTQDTQLFSGTIRENLLFVRPDASDAECLEVMHKAAADSLLSRADKGLDTVIGEGGVKVSGGEKQRLSIARALLRRPHLIVFDEATSSLDSLTEEEISRTMRDVADDRHVMTILIAHRLSTVMHADRIFVLERGELSKRASTTSCSSGRDCISRCGVSRLARRRIGPACAAAFLPATAVGRIRQSSLDYGNADRRGEASSRSRDRFSSYGCLLTLCVQDRDRQRLIGI